MQHATIDMKKLFYIVFGLMAFFPAAAQQDTVAVRDAAQLLEQSLMGKNSAVLNGLLHEDLVFGHSNGWVQKKSDVIADMESGSLIYRSFLPESLRIERIGKRAIVKEYVQVQGDRNGAPFKVRLFVMQEWVLGRKGWQLILRQGARQQ
jgi:hypothetical protein